MVVDWKSFDSPTLRPDDRRQLMEQLLKGKKMSTVSDVMGKLMTVK